MTGGSAPRSRLRARPPSVALGAVLAGSALLAACGSASEPTTTVPATTLPRPVAGGSVYLLHAGTLDQPGPLLQPLWVAGATTPRAALGALLAGPPSLAANPLASPALSSAIPVGTRLLGLSIAGATARIDLSAGYAAGGGSTAMLARLAQVVYTATQFPGITRVAFELDGEPVQTFSAEGIAVGGGVTRAFFSGTGLVPRILVEHPAVGEPVRSPFTLSGAARDVPGARLTYELTRGGEELLARGTVTTSGTIGSSTFREEVRFATARRERIDLVVYLGAATAPTGVFQIPFYLEPSPAARAAATRSSTRDLQGVAAPRRAPAER